MEQKSRFLTNNFQPINPLPPKGTAFWKQTRVLHISLAFMVVVSILLVATIAALMYKNTKHVSTLEKQIIDKDKELAELRPNSDIGDINKLVQNVAKMLSLPTNEAPTVATVTDLSKLSGQEFFAKAQIGDKVLIYTNSKKAILYRPSENKIIEVAPIADQPQEGNVAGSETKK